MRIGIPRESRPGETLVAATAKTASQLAALGYDVVVEQGAGAAADQPDVAFTDAGVRVVPADEVWSSDVAGQGQRTDRRRDRPAASGRDGHQPDGAGAQPRAGRAARARPG